MFLGKPAASDLEGWEASERSVPVPRKPTPPNTSAAEPRQAAARAAERTTSEALFRGAKLLLIEHAGSEYRLQITSRGKLILTR